MASHGIATIGEVYTLPWRLVYPTYVLLVDREKTKRRNQRRRRRPHGVR